MTRRLWAMASLITMSAAGVHAASAPAIYYLSTNYFSDARATSPAGELLTIWGANLTGTSQVIIGGVVAESLKVVDDSTVTCSARKPNKHVPYTKLDLVLTTAEGTVTLPKVISIGAPGGLGVTAKGSDWAVAVEAVVAASPSPSITLKWPLERRATGYEISRKLRTDDVWTQVGTALGNATSWIDAKVLVGHAYEYEVKRTSTIMAFRDMMTVPPALTALTSYGYIYSGIDVPSVDHRGTVILVVDNIMAKACSTELAVLQDDLIGDGWSILRHDVGRGGVNDPSGAAAVKQLIINDYRKNPSEVKSVLLFGHVPVPYSGNFAPTGHPPGHLGAFPADAYYGDIDGVFTDNVVNITTATALHTSCLNVPGDGKFDQTWLPSEVELEVGRVDLWGMEGWGVSEVNQLKNYITKSHNHRHAIKVLPRRVLIQDRSTDGWNGVSQSGWRSWSPLVGSGNVTSGKIQTEMLTNKEEYLGCAVTGSGDNGGTSGLSAADLYKADPKVAFWTTYGSHHGDWDQAGNLLRAPLGSPTCGLTNMYGYHPGYHLHTLGLGGTFGEAIRLRQNNTTTYEQNDVTTSGGVHIALMGDPTLRLFAVKPPSALKLSKDGNSHTVLSWQASTDSPLLGYHVYRSAGRNGPFMRLTPDPVTPTTWTDNSVSSGTFVYQVKAAKLETTASGTYVNTSQATTASNGAGTLELSIPSYAQDKGAPPLQIAASGTIYQVSPVAVKEAKSGVTKMTITCLRVGGATGSVSVNYATGAPAGGAYVGTMYHATAGGVDYDSVEGTLTWADGDSAPKTFDINTYANRRPPHKHKFIPIRYSATGGATVKHPDSFHNYILNDAADVVTGN